MGLGISILAGLVIGFIFGVMITIVILFIRTKMDARKAIKDNPDIQERIIKSKKEDKKYATTQESSSPSSAGALGDGEGEPTTEDAVEPTPNEDDTNKRCRVSIPDSGFALRN